MVSAGRLYQVLRSDHSCDPRLYGYITEPVGKFCSTNSWTNDWNELFYPQMLCTYKLNNLLGVVVKARTSVKRGDPFEHDRDLIASPSRKSKKMTILDRQVKILWRYHLKWNVCIYDSVCICEHACIFVCACMNACFCICMKIALRMTSPTCCTHDYAAAVSIVLIPGCTAVSKNSFVLVKLWSELFRSEFIISFAVFQVSLIVMCIVYKVAVSFTQFLASCIVCLVSYFVQVTWWF